MPATYTSVTVLLPCSLAIEPTVSLYVALRNSHFVFICTLWYFNLLSLFRVAGYLKTALTINLFFMTTKEKIALAAQNNKLYCFKEGMFFKVYNQNAMWFTQHIKVYKINTIARLFLNKKTFIFGQTRTYK